MKGRSSKAVSSALLAVVALGAARLPAVAQGVADRAHETAHATLLPRRSSGRIVIVVSTDLQRLTVYDDGAPVATTTVSTGIADHPTPHGIFSIIAKERFHRSNLYSDAPMPWMQRITWSGVALHEGHVTGRPASHGCIRMPAAFATDLYRYTREGARVIIARDDVVPVPWGTLSIFNAGLERLAMTSATPAPAAQDTPATPDNLEIEGRPRITSTPWPLDRRDIAAKAPLSLLVNRKSGKLYVRRAFMPVFQIPITIDEPTRPLGTHLFVMQDNPIPLAGDERRCAGSRSGPPRRWPQRPAHARHTGCHATTVGCSGRPFACASPTGDGRLHRVLVDPRRLADPLG